MTNDTTFAALVAVLVLFLMWASKHAPHEEMGDDGERWCPNCWDSYNVASGCACGRK